MCLCVCVCIRGSFYGLSKFHLQHILCICISHLSQSFLFFSLLFSLYTSKTKTQKKNYIIIIIIFCCNCNQLKL